MRNWHDGRVVDDRGVFDYWSERGVVAQVVGGSERYRFGYMSYFSDWGDMGYFSNWGSMGNWYRRHRMYVRASSLHNCVETTYRVGGVFDQSDVAIGLDKRICSLNHVTVAGFPLCLVVTG